MSAKPFFLLLLLPAMAMGQQHPDSIVLEKINTAGKHSSIPAILTQLSDVYGPRLLGTSNYYHAAKWAKEQLKLSGADTAYFESFDQQYRGWNVQSFNMEMISPGYMHVIAYPLAYTKSTPGTIEASVMYVENIDSLQYFRAKLRGKILLLGQDFIPIRSSQEIRTTKISEELLQQAADNPDPNDLLIGYHSRRSTSQAIRSQELRRTTLAAFFQFCASEGVAALVEPSDYPYGILHADGNHHIPSYTKQSDIQPVASFVMANEHFGRLVRLIKTGIQPVLRLHLNTSFNYDPAFNVNVIGVLNGQSQQQVIIGAHLDSWHGGTGAVDNATGCAVMMEAIRLLKAADIKPKRSIKICLWGGEEQIFAGSRSYVAQHVGDLDNGQPKKDFSTISAYFNLDNGTGKIRGIYAQGNNKVKAIFEEYLSPFSSTVTLQNANQTDHELFDALNIPAFQFIQDPLNYISAVHHTSMDVMEYVDQTALKENAVIVAYLIYKVAMREDLLPRRDFISILPSMKGNTTFFLKGFDNARAVSLASDFNNWNMFGTPLAKVAGGWACKLDLPPGRYLYKYIVDGSWTADPLTPTEKLLKDGKGHAGLNELIVK